MSRKKTNPRKAPVSASPAEARARMRSAELSKAEDNVDVHRKICAELTALYEKKNHDYGDSFHKSYLEYGMVMPLIRLEDKLNRLKSLTMRDEAKVTDESIRDTLMDLANYSIMTAMELEGDENEDR